VRVERLRPVMTELANLSTVAAKKTGQVLVRTLRDPGVRKAQ
jgi:hypothetical protein